MDDRGAAENFGRQSNTHPTSDKKAGTNRGKCLGMAFLFLLVIPLALPSTLSDSHQMRNKAEAVLQLAGLIGNTKAVLEEKKEAESHNKSNPIAGDKEKRVVAPYVLDKDKSAKAKKGKTLSGFKSNSLRTSWHGWPHAEAPVRADLTEVWEPPSGKQTGQGKESARKNRGPPWGGGAYGVDYSSWETAVKTAGRFRYAWKPRRNTQKMLFYVKWKYYCTAMDRFHFDALAAARRNPQLEVAVWGPGFEGFDSRKGMNENIARTFGCGHFDIIFKFAGRGLFNTSEPCSAKTIVVDQMMDCHHIKCLPTFDPASHITLFRYAFIPLELFNMKERNFMEGNKPQLIGHSPECTLPDLYSPKSFEDRKPEAILVGKTGSWLYPMRLWLSNMIQKGKLGSRVKVQKHPGYRLRGVEASCSPRLPSVQHANLLSTTRVCLFDSSIIRKAIRKYVEAMVGGCVPAADLPFEMEEGLRPAVVDIEGASVKSVKNRLKNVIDNKQEWEGRALAGLEFAHKRLTCYSKIDGILDYVDQYRKGRRGYYFPFGFRLDCHSYDQRKHMNKEFNWNFLCYNGSEF